jgi:hypothetical protein
MLGRGGSGKRLAAVAGVRIAAGTLGASLGVGARVGGVEEVSIDKGRVLEGTEEVLSRAG